MQFYSWIRLNKKGSLRILTGATIWHSKVFQQFGAHTHTHTHTHMSLPKGEVHILCMLSNMGQTFCILQAIGWYVHRQNFYPHSPSHNRDVHDACNFYLICNMIVYHLDPFVLTFSLGAVHVFMCVPSLNVGCHIYFPRWEGLEIHTHTCKHRQSRTMIFDSLLKWGHLCSTYYWQLCDTLCAKLRTHNLCMTFQRWTEDQTLCTLLLFFFLHIIPLYGHASIMQE